MSKARGDVAGDAAQQAEKKPVDVPWSLLPDKVTATPSILN
jgi:hypothetical protein